MVFYATGWGGMAQEVEFNLTCVSQSGGEQRSPVVILYH